MTTADARVLVSVLRFDASADQRLLEMSRSVQQLLGRQMPPSFFPHVSLIPTEPNDEQDLLKKMVRLAQSTRTFDIVCPHLGWFPGGVLFLGATPTKALLSLHQACYELSSPGPNTPWIDLYGPGHWIPHCTIATDVPEHLQGDIVCSIFAQARFPIVLPCTSIELLRMEAGKTQRLGCADFVT